MKYQLLAIGDTTLDTFLSLDKQEAELRSSLRDAERQICFSFADKIPVSDYHTTLGGNAANVAVTAASLEIKTAIWTIMGGDHIAVRAREFFVKEGVGLDYFMVEKSNTSDMSTIINYQGERTILSYKCPKEYHLPNFAPVSWVYLTSMGKGVDGVLDQVGEWAGSCGAKLVYQPGIFELRLGPSRCPAVLKNSELIIMNKEEAAEYIGLTNNQDTITKDLLKGLLDLGPKIAVITDGAKGAYASDGKTVWSQGVDETVPVVERTGAGDAYASALTAAIMKGKDIAEAMLWGSLNSESVIQKVGPQAGILTLEELNKLREQGRPKVEITRSDL